MQIKQEDLKNLERRLTDEGKLIAAGWIGLRIAAIRRDAPEAQIAEIRMAFFAGAQHLFSSIMTILDVGTEPTNAESASKRQQYLTKTGEFSTRINRDAHELESHNEPADTIADRIKILQTRIGKSNKLLSKTKKRLKEPVDERTRLWLEIRCAQIKRELESVAEVLRNLHKQTEGVYIKDQRRLIAFRSLRDVE